MPISADPNDDAPYVLRVDRAKLEQLKLQLAEGEKAPEPPTFCIRFHTSRERRQIRKLIASAEDAATADRDEEAEALLDQAIARGATRWERVVDVKGNLVTDTTAASAILSDTELWELAYATLRQPRLTEEERRNFVPPSAGSGASPASAEAPAAPASA